MKKILFLIFFLSFILVLPTVQSWGPNTHNKLAQDILSDNSTTIGRLCSSTETNKEAYLLGVVAPDITVIYYYEEGGKEYRLSHNWNFQQEVTAQAKTENEQCFAYGVAAHLIQDGIAHTMAVPSAIENYYLPNWILHPLLEKKYDSALALKYPELLISTPHIMDALDGPNGERYVEMIENAMGENSQIDVKNELRKLQIAISGGNFYDKQFRPSGNVWLFQLYPYIDKLTNILAPFIGTVNFGEINYYYEKSKEQTVDIFNNWGARYAISPHGFKELSQADKEATNILLMIFIASLIIPIRIAYVKRNRYWLILIPISILITIVVVYALI